MRLIEAEIPRDGKIIVFGCMHSGAANCHWSGIEQLVSALGARDTIGINTGDNIEGKIPYDKHYDRSSIDLKRMILDADDQIDALTAALYPVRYAIKAIGRGNHEYKLRATTDAGQRIAKALGVNYGWYNYKLIAKDDKGAVRFKVHVHHGMGKLSSQAKDPVQAKANKEAALKQKFITTRISDCIVHCGSHWHQQLVVRPTYINETHIIDRDNKITQHVRVSPHQADDWIPSDARWYAAVGCFRMTYTQPDDEYDDYAEIGGYGASDLGWTEISINDYQVTDVRNVRAGEWPS